MGKKTIITAYKVTVEVPQQLGYHGLAHTRTHDVMMRICSQVKQDIMRHVDLDDKRNVHIETEKESVCEHCGSSWTEGDSPHNGGCCDEDVKVMEMTDVE